MHAYLEWPQLMEAKPNEAQAQTRECTPHGVWVVLLPCVPCQEDGERPENKTNVLPAHPARADWLPQYGGLQSGRRRDAEQPTVQQD